MWFCIQYGIHFSGSPQTRFGKAILDDADPQKDRPAKILKIINEELYGKNAYCQKTKIGE